MEKSTLIGKVFKACIFGKITYEEALTLSEMVNRALWRDLERLFQVGNDVGLILSFYTDNFPIFGHWERLFTAGLCSLKNQGLSLDDKTMLKYEKNDYAKALTMIHEGRFDDLRQCAIGVVKDRE